MSSNCVCCGKFMSRTEGAICSKCDSVTHRACAGLAPRAKIPASWFCAACQVKQPKGRDPSTTPVRSTQTTYSSELPQTSSIEPMNLDDTAHNITAEFSDAELQLHLRPLKEEFSAEVMKMHENYMAELKSFRGDFRTHCSEMHELKAELTTLRATVEACNERAAEVEKKMALMELARCQQEDSTKNALEQTISELKAELNDREQEALLNDVELTGVPEEKGENPAHIASVLASAMGMTLDERDIVLAERIGAAAGRPQTGESAQLPTVAAVRTRKIVVRFARRCTHDEYIRAARVRRGLTSADVGVGGPSVRIYVNERLSRVNRQLFAKSREACRRHQWKYCWSKEGRIYVRKEHGAVVTRVRNERDIERVFGVGSV